MLEHELSSMVETIIELNDKIKYNIALGYFQEYYTNENDVSGKRFCNAKLHYRDADGNDIDAVNIPLIYFGNGNTAGQFELEFGCDLLVLFSDRSLEQWITATEPQALTNKVKDSKNHSFAIPISTHHTFNDLTSLALDSTVGYRRVVKSGKKIQIGNDVDEMMKIHYDLITAYLGGVNTSTGLSNNQAQITTLQTQLANITKI